MEGMGYSGKKQEIGGPGIGISIMPLNASVSKVAPIP